MKNVHFFGKFAILMFLLLPFSCAKDDVASQLDKLNHEDYFPLEVGNFWQMELRMKKTIDAVTTIDNLSYYRLVYGGDTLYYRETSDGRVYERRKGVEEYLKFDLSADEGDVWTYTTGNFDHGWYAKLVSKNETVSVGGHTFKHCYRFFFDIPQMADEEHSIWLAPGIGFIEEYYSGGTGQHLLKKAEINGVKIDL